jgi:PDDEXK-like domain of unknown function (DUF3799)
MDYREIPRVSNSDLTRFKEEQLGFGPGRSIPPANLERAKIFGRAFHQHLLEPETIGAVLQQFLPDLLAPQLTDQDTAKLQTLTKTIKHDAFCQRYLRKAERERVVLWTDPHTRIECKSRLDVVYTSPKRRNALILDFKTTSARTQAQFLQSCYDYDYDRQAAFYLDGLLNAEPVSADDTRNATNRLLFPGEWATTRQFRFVFVGIMKQSPNRIFAVDATSIPGFVDYGRKKYRFWLRKWQEENNKADAQLIRRIGQPEVMPMRLSA